MKASSFTNSLIQLLPDLHSCDLLQLEAGDVIIHAPGFEDRTMAVTDIIQVTSKAHGILLEYLPANAKNLLHNLRDALVSKGVEVTNEDILEYDRFDPGDFETRLKARLLIAGAQRAIVDISTMSKLAIMLVLNVCHRCNLYIKVFYSEAQTYGPSKEEFELAKERNEIHRPTLQVFTGVHGVVRVNSLASVAMQGQQTAALVFMSFNDALTQILLNTVYPGRLFLINGKPPIHSWREEATAWIHDQVRREWSEDNPVYLSSNGGIDMPQRAVSTLDYRQTVLLLIQLYWQLSTNHRVLLAPAGSKLQAVGCFLIKALHQDIHVEYPSPEGFLSYYSFGIGTRWLVNLGRISPLLSKISKLERHEYLEIQID